MIEVTEKIIDGAKFYTYSLSKPDIVIYGIPIYQLSDKILMGTDVSSRLSALGLRFVAHYPACRYRLYAQYPIPYFRFKVLEFLARIYWAVLHFSYNNACLFRRIPEGECFSWKYCFFYCWYKSLQGISARYLSRR